MKPIDRSKPVLVTGGSGYVASWIIKMLLDDGTHVHATVRDPLNEDKVGHLTTLAKESSGSLALFQSDLLDLGSFDEAMKDCELVIHTASPFIVAGIKDAEQQLVRPAKEGVQNVLASANKTPTVKRVVLTSSVVAIYGDNADIRSTPSGIFTEKEWNTTSSAAHQPYPYSKTIAEKEALSIAEKQNQWDLVTINPGWVFGPSVSKRADSLSISTMIQFGDGTYKSGAPELWNGIVDVRDVATAHIRAGFTPEATGRHILVCKEASLLDFAGILRAHFGDAYPFPKKQIPKWLCWLMASVFGVTRKYIQNNVGIRIQFDNTYSTQDLDMSYIPVAQTVVEHFQQLLDDGLLANKS